MVCASGIHFTVVVLVSLDKQTVPADVLPIIDVWQAKET
jgi:hypothetical protein